MTRASACLRVFTPPASSRARRARPPACSLPPTTTIPIRRSFPSTSPASSASARLHPPHPSVSILPATPTYPSHSRRVFLAPDAFDAFYLSSTRSTCSRRVSSATDASNPPSTRLSGPRRVFLILDASSSSSTRLPHPRRVLSGLPRSRLVDGLSMRFSHRNDFHPLDVLIVPEMDLSATFPLRFGGCPVGTSFL